MCLSRGAQAHLGKDALVATAVHNGRSTVVYRAAPTAHSPSAESEHPLLHQVTALRCRSPSQACKRRFSGRVFRAFILRISFRRAKVGIQAAVYGTEGQRFESSRARSENSNAVGNGATVSRLPLERTMRRVPTGRHGRELVAAQEMTRPHLSHPQDLYSRSCSTMMIRASA